MSTGHRRIDERSLAMHRRIADKLRADPELLSIAKENLDRWHASAGRSRPYLDTWREILTRPTEDICLLIVENSEAMATLRQNSPFAGVLTPRERWAIYAQFERPREGQPA